MASRFLIFGLLCGLMLPLHAASQPLQIVTQLLPETRGNPFSYNALPAGIINHAVFDGLISIGASAEVEPLLAESWEQESPTTWVFKLRPNVKFSNGVPFTADAVTSAVAYLFGDPVPADSLSSRVFRDKVSRVWARDDLTVVFETHSVDPILPIHLTVLRIPEPGQWAEGSDVFATEPVGTGPYVVKSWSQLTVRLASNPEAWRPGLISEIEVQAVSDQTARAAALFSGSADVAIDISSDSFDASDDGSYSLQPRASTMIQFIQFITVGGSPLKDVRVRRALNYAVNKQRLIDVFLRGAVSAATQFTHEDAVGFNPILSAYEYDPDKAKQLLAEAGWEKGLDVPTVFVGGSGSDIAIYQLVASDLAAVGVNMELRSMTLPIWMGHLFSGNWPSKAFVTGVQGFDPLGAFMTRSCDWPNPHFCDEDVMPLLNTARSSETQQELVDNINVLMAYERNNPPGILLWRRVSFDGLSENVSGYEANRDFLRFDLLARHQ